MQRKWRIIPHDANRIEQLMKTARLPAVVAQLLVSRGVYNAEQLHDVATSITEVVLAGADE